MQESQQLTLLLTPTITALGYELLGCEYFKQGRRGLLRIYIDKQGGVSLDDCEKTSRQVSALLDVENPLKGAYILEVSSPGIPRPLFTKAHYEQYCGSKVVLRLRYLVDERKHLRGILQAVEHDNIVIRDNGIETKVPFSAIQKGHVLDNDSEASTS